MFPALSLTYRQSLLNFFRSQVGQNEIQRNFLEPKGMMLMTGDQNIDDVINVDVSSDNVFAQEFQSVKHKLFAGNQEMNTKLQVDIANVVRVQVL